MTAGSQLSVVLQGICLSKINKLTNLPRFKLYPLAAGFQEENMGIYLILYWQGRIYSQTWRHNDNGSSCISGKGDLYQIFMIALRLLQLTDLYWQGNQFIQGEYP